jgi:hypothetical protein
MKTSEENMEILEAYNLTGSLCGAAALARCDHKTVASTKAGAVHFTSTCMKEVPDLPAHAI